MTAPVPADPLCELAQVIARQEWHQLGLPNEDNVQELLAGRLEIRQKPDLFEHLDRETLRLVNEEHSPPAARVGVQEVAVERVDEYLRARCVARIGDLELVAHGRQELGRFVSRGLRISAMST